MPLTVSAVGDIMLGRGMDALDQAALRTVISPTLAEAMRADLVTANLECVLGSGGAPNPNSHSRFICSTNRAVEILKAFDVVSVANNHAFDFGAEGLRGTLSALESIRLPFVGAGETYEDARKPVIFERAQRRIAVFGATTVANRPEKKGPWVTAAPDRSFLKEISKHSEQGCVVIVHLHAGGGDCAHPAPAVREIHADLRASGADLIFGHHPHVVQGYEREHGRISFYALGDFIFDRTDGSRDVALMIRATVTSRVGEPEVELHPVRRCDDLRLNLLEGRMRQEVLNHIRELVEALSSNESDRAYFIWYGSPLERLMQSLRADWRAGGFRALAAKARRIDRSRVKTVIGSLLQRLRRSSGRG